ncbi:hypothetical protein SAMN05444004_10236 [Jannaschia faecimaris]|uniref:Uncharacterized protein n=1 Tax=Jannaschia faecimaris TaxID=1244108 RepID=A0A1H3KZ31_9RHOB|nr:hypothetical protein [Jannaschia faecimaris]SDY57497.1 hypothetical protein SAMN05444004_10236 [Jannaschia faecimaris]
MTDNAKLDRTVRIKGGAVAALTPAQGTTHDPNSVTTGTSVEPTRDVYPPKGEDDYKL